ncbi:molybdenum cofactor guanylyltransferase [Aliicoccus persicus]|uniref:Probable molybdenum cofactor guanylyltransferase n=1 Tax=Aliicoccus persicus TaxID=930138 RepID=A0A662Z5D4_9STAP|nr:molybdenum cofactor guanylyltransferase [Aliicoccus persicus]SEV99859.1 molybdopterin-guanine dinucleotide biosynthesis protein A [Aliicoccus persicus]
MRTIGIILTGGRSTRFGEDKSLYKIDGKPMYQHVYDLVDDSGVTDEIIISTNETLKDEFGAHQVIVDEPSLTDVGPLGGLYAVAKKYPGSRFILVSCDTPYIPSSWIKRLVEHAEAQPGKSIITLENSMLHPTIAVFDDPELVDKLATHLNSGGRSIRSFFDQIDVTFLDVIEEGFDRENFININRKSELK